MSRSDLFTILDECVSRLRRGEAPEACLADYPAHAGELAPDLALSADLLQLSLLEPPADAAASGYQQMMAAFDAQEKRPQVAGLPPLLDRFLERFLDRLLSPLRRPRIGLGLPLLRTAAIAVMLVIAAGSFVITAAADTLPGDVLYPVKRSWENTRLALTVDESSRQTLQTELEQRRRAEVRAVLDLRKPVIVEFKGILESAAAELWLVDGLDLHLTADTRIEGAIDVGQKISVRAQVRDDGSLEALKIVGDDNQPPPAATDTQVPSATQTSEPTRRVAAPTPTSPVDEPRSEPTAVVRPGDRATATPTPTHQPTATHKPNDRPTEEPTSTHAPSLDREATRTPHPTNTPAHDSLATSLPPPTSTPAFNAPTPTPTDRPTDAVRPSPTPTSKPNREPTATHEATATRSSDLGDHNNHPP